MIFQKAEEASNSGEGLGGIQEEGSLQLVRIERGAGADEDQRLFQRPNPIQPA